LTVPRARIKLATHGSSDHCSTNRATSAKTPFYAGDLAWTTRRITSLRSNPSSARAKTLWRLSGHSQLSELGHRAVEQSVGRLRHRDRDQIPGGMVEPIGAVAAVPTVPACFG